MFFWLMGVPFVLTYSIPTSYLGAENGFFLGNSLIMRGTTFPAVIIAGFFFQTGWVVAVKIFRWFSTALILNYLFTFIYFTLAVLGLAPYHVTRGNINARWSLALCLLFLPCPFFLVRTLRNVRWYDPKSRPEEWEPPGRSKDELMAEGRARRAAKRAEAAHQAEKALQTEKDNP